ncbi:MAG: cation diffusion facilitator family transporter [Phycisphaerae bacterium]
MQVEIKRRNTHAEMDDTVADAYHLRHMEEDGQGDRGILGPRGVTWLGLIGNASLGIGKVAVGMLFASQAIIADGFHSASDMISDVVVLAGLRVSRKPADGDHHYGHRRASTLVATFVGVGLVAASGWIAYKAITGMQGPFDAVPGPMPLIMALVSIPIKEVLYRLTRRAGNRSGDVSLAANAWHHRTDAFTSLAASVGIAGVMIGGEDWQFLDHATALVLAGFLLVSAVRIVRNGAEEMMDRAPGRATLQRIEQAVVHTPGVVGFHAFRARRVGGKVEMDIHVQVDPELSVRRGHEIASEVKRRVLEADSRVVEAIVHVEPADAAAGPLHPRRR